MDLISNKMYIIAASVMILLGVILFLMWGVYYPVALEDALMVDSPVLLIVLPAIFGLMTLMILLFLYLITRNVFDTGYRDRKAREGISKQKNLIKKLINL